MGNRVFNTRNFLILIGLVCEIVSVVTLTVATLPTDEIFPVTPMIEKMFKMPESAVRNSAMVTLKVEHEAHQAVNNVARSLAGVVSAIGLLVFVAAWWAHLEDRSRKALSANAGGAASQANP